MAALKVYSAEEERINAITHAFGLHLAVAGTLFLIRNKAVFLDFKGLVYLIYGFCQIAMYLASTLYHSARRVDAKRRLNVMDHAAIYLSIAGTYTPIAILLERPWDWLILVTVWILALIGVGLKIFFTGRYSTISTIAYVAMGWVIVIAIGPLIRAMAPQGLVWLLLGGLFFTVGAIFYQFKKLPFNHAIFHCFVLAGSCAHYWVILRYT